MRKGERLLIALASACAVAVAAYAALRICERALFPEPNPAIVIWSDRSNFVWRSLLALYMGGAGAFAGYALSARSPRAGARGLSLLIVIAATAITLQGTLVP